MSLHVCDAFVVSCIDFRFRNFLNKWFEEKMTGKTYDYVGYAGASKNIEIIMGQLDISVRLHQVKEVILINHEDCGAYGVESTHDRHAADLNRAKKTILKKYPILSVELFYLHLDGEFEKVK